MLSVAGWKAKTFQPATLYFVTVIRVMLEPRDALRLWAMCPKP